MELKASTVTTDKSQINKIACIYIRTAKSMLTDALLLGSPTLSVTWTVKMYVVGPLLSHRKYDDNTVLSSLLVT